MPRYRRRKFYKNKKKKSVFLRPLFWLTFFVLLLAGSSFYSAIFSSFFQIKQIVVSGNAKVASEEIKNIISEQINKKIALFDTKSIFLADLKEIDNAIRKTLPQVYQVYLKRQFPGIIYAKVEERQPVGIWCKGNDCFSLDKEGVIFEKTETQGELIIKSEETEKQIFLGANVIEKELLESILEIKKELKNIFKLETKEVIIPGNKQRLIVKTNEDWEIYFNEKDDIADQLVNLNLVLKTKIPLEKRGTLQYIDLRFGSKVYFKYRE